ncbi:MAG TPA: TIGR03435 family protein [Vicinamibacterales bacterium]|nr:TIGR03435 family protein [Vicinamibacterales bacterium]
MGPRFRVQLSAAAALAACVWLSATAPTIAQTPAPATPSAPGTAATDPKFEVASVRPNKSGANVMRIGMQPGGRFTAENVPLRQLVRFAYQLQDFQIVGGPDWVKDIRYDVVAKAENDVPPAQPGTVGPLQLMVRALLADRFKLKVHDEEREMPIYALVVARADKKLGDKLTPAAVDCQAMMAQRNGPPPAPAPNGRPTCGMRIGPGQMMGGGFPISQLASALSPMVQRYVVDRTGLTGNYDLEMTFTQEQSFPAPGGAAVPAVDPSGPSIYTALQEQLGLKLESQRGQVKVLVIDAAEQPTED